MRERNLGKHLEKGTTAGAPQNRHIENYKKTLKDQRSFAAIVKREGGKVPETLAKKIRNVSIASSVASTVSLEKTTVIVLTAYDRCQY